MAGISATRKEGRRKEKGAKRDGKLFGFKGGEKERRKSKKLHGGQGEEKRPIDRVLDQRQGADHPIELSERSAQIQAHLKRLESCGRDRTALRAAFFAFAQGENTPTVANMAQAKSANHG